MAHFGSIFAHGLSGATPRTFQALFASALNELLVIAACVALVAAALAPLLIHQRDFVAHGGTVPVPAPSPS